MSGFGRLARLFVVVGLALGLAACGSGSGGSGSGGPGASGNSDQDAFVRPSLPGMGGPTAWPSAMPADIPAFPYHLDSFMPQRRQSGDSYGVRMFFSGVTLNGLQIYLGNLKAAGYTLEPKAYYTPPQTEEDAKARVLRGDYDAWVATRAPRVLTVTVPKTPDGKVTFDVDGLTKAESDALPGMGDFLGQLPTPTIEISKGWPAEWAGKVPAPDGCIIGANGNMTVTPTSLYVACGYPDKDPVQRQAVVDAYRAKLLGAGFAVDGPDSGQFGGMYRYVKGALQVMLLTGGEDFMIINATER